MHSHLIHVSEVISICDLKKSLHRWVILTLQEHIIWKIGLWFSNQKHLILIKNSSRNIHKYVSRNLLENIDRLQYMFQNLILDAINAMAQKEEKAKNFAHTRRWMITVSSTSRRYSPRRHKRATFAVHIPFLSLAHPARSQTQIPVLCAENKSTIIPLVIPFSREQHRPMVISA